MKAGRANFFHARTEVDPDDQTTSFARSNSLSDDVTDESEQRSSSETKMEKRSRSYVAVEGHILNIPLELNGGKSKTY